MLKKTWMLLFAMCGPLALVATADWNPGDPYKMHFPQLPDLKDTGMDVESMWPESCADDWLCTKTGPVSDIHVWGSFFNDVGSVAQFRLNIYADVPAGTGGLNYSRPGAFKWTSAVLLPTQWTQRPYAVGIYEHFYDPEPGQVLGHDTVCWQYNFLFDPATSFQQEVGTTYWLEVIAWTDTGLWGWKTADLAQYPLPGQHFQDDAVWLNDAGQWVPLVYPFGHPMEYQSLDLAFVITTIPEPATIGLLTLGTLGLAALRRRRK